MGRNIICQKVHFSGSKLTWNSKPLVDQSSPDLFHRTRNESLEITCLSDFRYLAPFRRYLRSKSEMIENCPKFCMFLPPFFGGSAPRIFGLNLSNRTSFRSYGKVSRRSVEGRRKEAGERKKKKKHHEHFIRPPVTTYTGGKKIQPK